jgi:hypothetical protein
MAMAYLAPQFMVVSRPLYVRESARAALGPLVDRARRAHAYDGHKWRIGRDVREARRRGRDP